MALNYWFSCLPFRVQKRQVYATPLDLSDTEHWTQGFMHSRQAFYQLNYIIFEAGTFTEPIRSSRNTNVCFPAALELQHSLLHLTFTCYCGSKPRSSCLQCKHFTKPSSLLLSIYFRIKLYAFNYGRKSTKLSEWHNCDLSSINILFANKLILFVNTDTASKIIK